MRGFGGQTSADSTVSSSANLEAFTCALRARAATLSSRNRSLLLPLATSTTRPTTARVTRSTVADPPSPVPVLYIAGMLSLLPCVRIEDSWVTPPTSAGRIHAVTRKTADDGLQTPLPHRRRDTSSTARPHTTQSSVYATPAATRASKLICPTLTLPEPPPSR